MIKLTKHIRHRTESDLETYSIQSLGYRSGFDLEDQHPRNPIDREPEPEPYNNPFHD